MRVVTPVFLVVIMSLTGLACGDSGADSNADGPTCSGDGACGGKLEGSWKLDDACYVVLKQPEISGCPDATAELHAREFDGSISFDGDSYERHVEIETEMVLKLPEKCQEEGGKKKECVSFGGPLRNGSTLICADADGDNDGCECSALLKSTFNEDGAFTIRGNRVQLVAEQLDYCVKGDKLTLKPTESINMSGTEVTSQLQTTFVKN
jgi:hypothetical protein